MDKYDMVIHLVTAADGKEEYYTLENNNARSESVDEAKILDKKTMNAWLGHNNLKIISNKFDFETKINNTINEINNLLGEDISLRYQRKFLIDLDESSFNFNIDNCTKIDIIQTYLDNYRYEKRLRKRIYNNEETYFITTQLPNSNSSKRVVTNQKISKKEYEKIYMLDNKKYEINKTRYTFMYNKQYFRLDKYNNIDNLAILEVDVKNLNDTVNIPKNIKIIQEVTNDKNYNNYELAKNNIKLNNKVYVKK